MPNPSPAIVAEYEKLEALSKAHQFDQALADSVAVLKAAQDAHDLIGEALVLGLRASLYLDTKHPAESATEMAAAGATLERAGQRPMAIRAMSSGAFDRIQYGLPGGDELLARALDLARQETNRPGDTAAALYDTAVTLYKLKRSEQAKSFLQAAAPLQRRLSDPAPLADTLVMLGIIGTDDANTDDALAVFREALSIRNRIDPDALETSPVLYNLAMLEYERNDLHSAIAHFRQAVKIYDLTGYKGPDLPRSLLHLGEALMNSEDIAAGRTTLARAVDLLRTAFPGSSRLAEGLHNLGVCETRLGDLPDARKHLEEGLALSEKVDTDAGHLVTSHIAIAQLASKEGNSDDEKQHYLRALDIEQKSHPDSPRVAEILDNLGDANESDGNFSAAEEYKTRALSIVERSGDPGKIADSLQSLGNTLGIDGKLPASIAMLQRAVALLDQADKQSPKLPYMLRSLAAALVDAGNLKPARQALERARALEEANDKNSIQLARTIQRLGTIDMDEGHFEIALDELKRAEEIARNTDPQSVVMAQILNIQGAIAKFQGDFRQAADLYRQALPIAEKADEPHAILETLNGLGNAYADQGDMVTAEEYYRRAITIQEKHGKDSMEITQSLGNLGMALYNQRKYREAEQYDRRLVAMLEKAAPDSPRMAAALQNLAAVLASQNNTGEAEQLLKRAIAIYEKAAPGSLAHAQALTGLAEVTGGLSSGSNEIDAYLRKALEIEERIAPGSLVTAETLKSLSDHAHNRQDFEQARALARRAWELVRSGGAVISSDEGRQAYGETLAVYASSLAGEQIAAHDFTGAFATLEDAKSQALELILSERNALASTLDHAVWLRHMSLTGDLTRAETSLRAAEDDLRFATVAGDAEPDLAKLAARADQARVAYLDARRQSDEMWTSIGSLAPRMAAPPVDLELAGRVLPEETVFASFSLEQRGVSVLVVYRDAQGKVRAEPGVWFQMDFGKAPHTDDPLGLSKTVDEFRRLVTDKDSDPEKLASLGNHLFMLLFPLQAHDIILHAKRLLIAPDGPLWGLPFAALTVNVNGPPQYLGDKVAITYTQSFRLFQQSREEKPRLQPGQRPVALIVGHPAFDRGQSTAGESSLGWENGRPPSQIESTRREAEQVAALYHTSALMDGAATEAEVRKRIESADVIEFATHGVLHPSVAMSSGILLAAPAKSTPGASDAGKSAAEIESATHGVLHPSVAMSSGILLAPPAKPTPETSDDGILQAWEIFSQLKLRAELVVLSACRTALGKTVKFEGIVGLTRSLQYAGARSVVASQWSVEDDSTTELMIHFHRNLRQGMAKDKALQLAMRAVRENPRTAHPYYWAPFLLVGDPDNSNLGTEAAR